MPQLKVLPTVAVDAQAWRENPKASAEACIADLVQLHPGGSLNGSQYRGLVKLGFNCTGDVKPFTGPDELAKAVLQMVDGVQGSAACFVQERLEHVVGELRAVCVRDLASGASAMAKELVWVRLCAPRASDDDKFAVSSEQSATRAEAVQFWFRGSSDAASQAEAEVKELTDAWLKWLCDEGFGLPAACRFDFLIAAGGDKSTVTVRSLGLHSGSSSFCGLPNAARSAAALNECFNVEGCSRAPQVLPSLQPLPPPTVSAVRRQGSQRGRSHQSARESQSFGALLYSCVTKLRARHALLALLLAFVFVRLRHRQRLI
jgi:hypothetical protein